MDETGGNKVRDVLTSAVVADLGSPQRIWVIGAIFGRAERLADAHKLVREQFRKGDRLIYLGNMWGQKTDCDATHCQIGRALLDIQHLRQTLLAQTGCQEDDIVYLRGAQEEMLHKLMQIQFAPCPGEVLAWMLDHGVAATIESYGIDVDTARQAARAGTMALTRWTQHLRHAVNSSPGHRHLLNSLKHVAMLKRDVTAGNKGALFASAGLPPASPLSTRNDSYWWSCSAFEKATAAPTGFDCVFRGYCPEKESGLDTNFRQTLYGGESLHSALICTDSFEITRHHH